MIITKPKYVLQKREIRLINKVNVRKYTSRLVIKSHVEICRLWFLVVCKARNTLLPEILLVDNTKIILRSMGWYHRRKKLFQKSKFTY